MKIKTIDDVDLPKKTVLIRSNIDVPILPDASNGFIEKDISLSEKTPKGETQVLITGSKLNNLNLKIIGEPINKAANLDLIFDSDDPEIVETGFSMFRAAIGDRAVSVKTNVDPPDQEVCTPQNESIIEDDSILQSSLETIKAVHEAGTKVIVAGTLGEPEGRELSIFSTECIGRRITELTNLDVLLPTTWSSFEEIKVATNDFKQEQICLLQNLKFHPGEDNCTDEFAQTLASMCDLYILDDFSSLSENTASVLKTPQMVETVAGLNLKDKITEKHLDLPNIKALLK